MSAQGFDFKMEELTTTLFSVSACQYEESHVVLFRQKMVVGMKLCSNTTASGFSMWVVFSPIAVTDFQLCV